MLIVVSYDVPNDRRRTRLAHALKDFGGRVQYSVFECHLDEKALQALRDRVLRLIDLEEECQRQITILAHRLEIRAKSLFCNGFQIPRHSNRPHEPCKKAGFRGGWKNRPLNPLLLKALEGRNCPDLY